MDVLLNENLQKGRGHEWTVNEDREARTGVGKWDIPNPNESRRVNLQPVADEKSTNHFGWPNFITRGCKDPQEK